MVGKMSGQRKERGIEVAERINEEYAGVWQRERTDGIENRSRQGEGVTVQG